MSKHSEYEMPTFRRDRYMLVFVSNWHRKEFFQCALEFKITSTFWSLSWKNINRLAFDILLVSYCKYHMDINMWGQYVYKMCLENDHWKKDCDKTFGKKTFSLNFVLMFINFMPTVDVTKIFLTCRWSSVDVNCWHPFYVNFKKFDHWGCRWTNEYTMSSLNNLFLH